VRARGSSRLIAVLAAIVIIPILLASFAAIRSATLGIASAREERAGIARLADLRALEMLLWRERGETRVEPQTESSRDALVGKINTEETHQPLAGDAWATVLDTLPRDPTRPGEIERPGYPVFRAILAAGENIRKRAHLVTSAGFTPTGLGDATFRIPRIVDQVEQVALLLNRMLREGRITVAERVALAAGQGRRTTILSLVFEDISSVAADDPKIERELAPELTLAQKSALEVTRQSDQLANGSIDDERSVVRLRAAVQKLILDLDSLQAVLQATRERTLDARIAELGAVRILELIPATLGTAAVIILGIVVRRNVRHRDEMAEVLRQSERLSAEARFRAVFEHAATGIVILQRDGRICETNATFSHMLGYPAEYFIGRRLSRFTIPEERQATIARFEAMRDGVAFESTFEKRYIRANGSVIWVDVALSTLQNDDPSGWFAMVLVEDISERKRIESQLLYDATHDGLTDLANRSLFASRLDDVLATRPDGTAAVIFIDLDHFKIVNDSLGHAAGDQLLRTVARRLAEFAGPADTVARFGGDEFAILFGELAHVVDLTRRVKSIQDRVAEPLEVDGRAIYTTASIGVAPLTPRYTDAEELLRDADTAMYRAKAEGRARAAMFDHAMHEGAVRRLQLTSDLRGAIDNNELRIAYQPIVRLKDRSVIGYEALVRWLHPTDGLLMPASFIPLAEETGLIVPMGRWIINEACRYLAEMRADGNKVVMHVNVSVMEIMHGDLAAYVEERLIRNAIPPECLIVEITENAIIESTRNADMFLQHLRSIGVGICIDDFGVGYSSLRYLHRLPISGLKIDRSFINGADDDLASEPIVRMLLELAHTLGLDVVAEGVEHEVQSAALQVLGCQYGQGYLFSPPETRALCV
jgi:diguanylate cyclase (GGDEF)-like protein/PAS domain S-box-containing protein